MDGQLEKPKLFNLDGTIDDAEVVQDETNTQEVALEDLFEDPQAGEMPALKTDIVFVDKESQFDSAVAFTEKLSEQGLIDKTTVEVGMSQQGLDNGVFAPLGTYTGFLSATQYDLTMQGLGETIYNALKTIIDAIKRFFKKAYSWVTGSIDKKKTDEAIAEGTITEKPSFFSVEPRGTSKVYESAKKDSSLTKKFPFFSTHRAEDISALNKELLDAIYSVRSYSFEQSQIVDEMSAELNKKGKASIGYAILCYDMEKHIQELKVDNLIRLTTELKLNVLPHVTSLSAIFALPDDQRVQIWGKVKMGNSIYGTLEKNTEFDPKYFENLSKDSPRIKTASPTMNASFLVECGISSKFYDKGVGINGLLDRCDTLFFDFFEEANKCVENLNTKDIPAVDQSDAEAQKLHREKMAFAKDVISLLNKLTSSLLTLKKIIQSLQEAAGITERLIVRRAIDILKLEARKDIEE